MTIDNKKAGYDAASELIRRGHRNIVYISGTRRSSSAIGRIEGYKAALSEAGIEYNPDLVAGSKSVYEHIMKTVNGIIEKNGNIDAILTNSDLQASYVLKGMKEGLIKLPADISLISFDGTFVSEITSPSLSAVAQPMFELGQASVRVLIELINNKDQALEKTLYLPHQLIKRET